MNRALPTSLLVLIAFWPGIGCLEGNTNSESHLSALRPCQDDADCDGLECLCGICTAPCDHDLNCPKRFGRTAADPPFTWEDGACFDLSDVSFTLWCESASESEPLPSACLAPCETDADCPEVCASEGDCPAASVNARLSCHEGACLWDEVTPPLSLTVIVERVEPTIFRWAPYRSLEGTIVLGSAEGATVALQGPDGIPVEVVTDVAGVAVFEDVNWALGAYAVTAYLPGHVIYSRVGIDQPPADALEIRLAAYGDETAQVRVAGEVVGPDAGMGLVVTSISGGFYSDLWDDSSSFGFDIEAGESHTLVATEFGPALDDQYRDQCDLWEYEQTTSTWAVVETETLIEDAVVHINLVDDAASHQTLTGTFELPERASSRVSQACDEDLCELGCTSAWGFVTIWSNPQLIGRIGQATSMSQAAGSVQYSVEYAVVPGVDRPMVHLQLSSPNGDRSMAWGDVELAGDSPRLLDVPEWHSGQDIQGIDEPVEWLSFEDDADTYVTLYGGDPYVVWVIAVPDGAETALIPEAPSPVDLGALFVNNSTIEVSHIRTSDALDYTSFGPMRPLDLGLVTDPTPITVSVALDDRANQTYTPDDRLAVRGPFRHGVDFDNNGTVDDDESNLVQPAPDWSGPYPLLFDDGPVSSGGHEPEGAMAGDHIWGVVMETGPPPVTYDVEYGFVRDYDRESDPSGGVRFWQGPNVQTRVPAAATGPVVLESGVIPAFGPVDLRLEVNTAELAPDWLTAAGVTEIDSVAVRTSALAWDTVELADDGAAGDQTAGDGVFTFVLSEWVGAENGRPHEGLRQEGDVVEWELLIYDKLYAFGPANTSSKLALIEGVWLCHDLGHEGESACLDRTADCIVGTIHRAANHNPALQISAE